MNGQEAMRTYKSIVLHCSATSADADIGACEIDKWHVARGWSQIGYHFVVRRDGTIERARPLHLPGAHTKGHNNYTIGVCYIGGVNDDNEPEDNMTKKQAKAFVELVEKIRDLFGPIHVKGHRDFPNVAKACPSFEVREKFGQRWCDGFERT